MPAKNQINDLRDHLFETIQALRDKSAPMEVARAQAIADVARVIVDSAKVEVQFLGIRDDARGTGFIGEPEAPRPREVGRPDIAQIGGRR